MSDKLTQRLENCYTGVVHDVMRAMGLKNFTAPKDIRPIFPNKILVGPVFTINGKVDQSATEHDTLLAWTGLLSKAKAAHVWVCQPNDDTVAHMGELSAKTLQLKDIRGAIADGAVRDVNFLLEMGFQTWSRGFTPRDIVAHWLPEGWDVPITIGEVAINPGDYCIGDRDGLIFIPASIVEEVIEKSETAIGTESLIRKAILDGSDPQEAYLKYGKF